MELLYIGKEKQKTLRKNQIRVLIVYVAGHRLLNVHCGLTLCLNC